MAKIYVELIRKGYRTYSSLIDAIKPEVRTLLEEMGLENLIDE